MSMLSVIYAECLYAECRYAIFAHYIQLKSLLGMNTQAYTYRVSMAVTHGVTVIKISSSLTIRKKIMNSVCLILASNLPVEWTICDTLQASQQILDF